MVLRRMAAAGCGLSAVWHAALRIDAMPPYWWMGGPLLAGLFLVWFPVVIIAGGRGLTFPHRAWRWAATILFVLAFLNLWTLEGHPVERRVSLALSGHLTAFYVFAVAMMPPAQGVKRWSQ